MAQAFLGYVLFLFIAFLLRGKQGVGASRNYKIILYGILFQIVLMFAMTHLPMLVSALESVARGVMKLQSATLEGTKSVFGYLGGDTAPFEMKDGGNTFVLAFQALPTVILVAALSAVLTYLKVLPFLSKIVGYVFKAVFNVSESIGMVAAARIFIGQLEAPLLVKQNLPYLSRSEMFTVLALAFATSSAAVTPVYAACIHDFCPNAMQHIIMSSVLNVISVLILTSVVMKNESTLMEHKAQNAEKPYSSFMGAMSKGLGDGMYIWWCIVGSLVGMIALITFFNYILELLPDFGSEPITLQRICGLIMYPFAWLIGIEAKDVFAVSQILGTKLVLNELVAFFDLAKSGISEMSMIKTIYAINNFGNFACIGITVGGMMALVPSQKSITELAGKAFVVSLLATGLSATLASLML